MTRLDESNRRDPPSVWFIDAARGIPTRLTSGVYARNAIWSPDSDKVAFSAAIDSPPNPFVRNADGTGTADRLLVSPNQSDATDWSRDGRFIVGNTIYQGYARRHLAD